MTKTIDQTDIKILAELQNDGRLSNADLARRVNLSATPCLERMRRLEREGYIVNYVAQLDPHKLGYPVVCFIQVTLDRTTPDVFDLFKESVVNQPEIQECHMVAGGFDYLLKIRLPEMAQYRSFLGDIITALPGVQGTHTYVVMEEVLSRGSIPLTKPVSK